MYATLTVQGKSLKDLLKALAEIAVDLAKAGDDNSSGHGESGNEFAFDTFELYKHLTPNQVHLEYFTSVDATPIVR